jgi:hypothetical protein
MRTFGLLFIFFLITISSSINIFGQEFVNRIPGKKSKKNFLNASLGINDFHLRDEYLSPYSYNGTLYSAAIKYQLKLTKSEHFINIGFSNGDVDSDSRTLKASQYFGTASYSFYYSLSRFEIQKQQMEIFIGIGLSTSFIKTDVVTPESITWFGPTDITWYWSHDINFHLKSDYKFSLRNNISVQLSIPLVSWVSRPDYGHNFSKRNIDVSNDFLNAASGAKRQFLWDNFTLLIGFEYRRLIYETLSLKGNYYFIYASDSAPLDMKMYMNNFLAGVQWQF